VVGRTGPATSTAQGRRHGRVSGGRLARRRTGCRKGTEMRADSGVPLAPGSGAPCSAVPPVAPPDSPARARAADPGEIQQPLETTRESRRSTHTRAGLEVPTGASLMGRLMSGCALGLRASWPRCTVLCAVPSRAGPFRQLASTVGWQREARGKKGSRAVSLGGFRSSNLPDPKGRVSETGIEPLQRGSIPMCVG